MLIRLVGSGAELASLSEVVKKAITTLAITDFVEVHETDDAAYKQELGISANPALCIEESSIDFRDMIFEGMIPAEDELLSMFSSIFGVGGEEE